MAEFVNQRIEDMIPELEQMKRIELYTPEEIRSITKKRKEFEYKIRRHVRCKEDFLDYVAYECLLLQNIRLRREKLSIDEKKTEIEYAISRRVSKLFKEMITRFPDDIQIWLNYMKFCKSADLSHTITSYLEKLVQIHGDKPKIWQLAAKWEYEEMSNLENARKFILKGIHRFPDYEQLYADSLRIELLVAEALADEEREKQLKRANVILENALQQCKNAQFIISMMAVLNDFDFTSSFVGKLFQLLWKNHSNDADSWAYVADCELKGKTVTDFNWKLLSNDEISINHDSNVGNFVNVYEIAIEQIKDKSICLRYIGDVMKFIVAEGNSNPTSLQMLNNALQRGHDFMQLKEEHYKIWLNLMSMDDTVTKDEIEKILKDASSHLPSSTYIWEERLKRVANSDKEFLKIFKLAKKSVSVDKVDSIWKLAIDNAQNLDKIIKLRDESISSSPATASKIKPMFLTAFRKYGDIKTARLEYATMTKTPPLVVELHDTMVEIERAEKTVDLKIVKNCYELAIQQFGKTNADVWLNYARFEMEIGHPERCGLLYARAISNLDDLTVDSFISKYNTINN